MIDFYSGKIYIVLCVSIYQVNLELRNLIYAAYLHDIGKFWQRVGKKSGTHAEWGQNFVREYLPNEEMIASLVGSHHDYRECRTEWEGLAKIIIEADHLSAGHDRADRDGDEKGDPKAEGLRCIFEKVSFGRQTEFTRMYPLKPLDFSDDQYPVDPMEYLRQNYATDLRQLYDRLWRAFVAEWTEIGRPDLRQLDALMKKYTSCIPSAVYVNEPDIPLYDHCKTTAAIASCLYFAQKGRKEFLLIEGDLSGIQNFIFDVASPADARKGMAKRLRGRSFWLGLLTRAVSDVLLQKAELSPANLLWNTGGKFVILAPNTPEMRSFVLQLERSVNAGLLSEYQGKLYLAFGMLEFGKERFAESFDCLLGELGDQIAEKKLRKFAECDLSFDAIGGVVSKEAFCPVCGVKLMEGKCPACSLYEDIGRKIAFSQYLVCGAGKVYPFDFSRIGLDVSYDLTSKPAGVAYHINDMRLGKDVSGFLVMGNAIPKAANEVLTFGDLALLAKGDKKLGVFKADMDRLGKVMSVGLVEGKRSISRIHTLSSRIEHFFCGMVNPLCSAYPVYLDETPDSERVVLESGQVVWVPNSVSGGETKPGISPLYIVYAGGDDLLIVGPYDRIILFADLFYRKFREYVCNNLDLTLSAGIAVSHPRQPITFSVLAASEQLETAKQAGRNRVCLLGECLLWDAAGTMECGFARLIRYGEQIETYVRDGVLTRSMLNSLSVLWVEYFGGKPAGQRAVVRRYLPQLMYMLKRNVSDVKIREELRSTMGPMFGWMQFPIQWALMRTRRV